MRVGPAPSSTPNRTRDPSDATRWHMRRDRHRQPAARIPRARAAGSTARAARSRGGPAPSRRARTRGVGVGLAPWYETACPVAQLHRVDGADRQPGVGELLVRPARSRDPSPPDRPAAPFHPQAPPYPELGRSQRPRRSWPDPEQGPLQVGRQRPLHRQWPVDADHPTLRSPDDVRTSPVHRRHPRIATCESTRPSMRPINLPAYGKV